MGELKLKISGCINACGHHHAGHIGILGVDRKGVENYQLSLGGSEAEDTALAKITGPGFDEDGIVDAVETAADVYLRDLDTVMRALLHHRLRGYAIDDVRPGYRAIRAASHLLVYRLVGDVVEIVRVLHRSMDLKAQI